LRLRLWAQRGVRGPLGQKSARRLVRRKGGTSADAGGRIPALAIVSANVQDRDTLTAFDDGLRHLVAERDRDQKGFAALA